MMRSNHARLIQNILNHIKWGFQFPSFLSVLRVFDWLIVGFSLIGKQLPTCSMQSILPSLLTSKEVGTTAKTHHFWGGNFCGAVTQFFYFICVTKNLLILWHVTRFVSKNTVIFALPHSVYVAVLFFHVCGGIYCSTSLACIEFCFTSRNVRKVVFVCHFTVVVYLIVVKVTFSFIVSLHTSP
jgi:hypothetical protein